MATAGSPSKVSKDRAWATDEQECTRGNRALITGTTFPTLRSELESPSKISRDRDTATHVLGCTRGGLASITSTAYPTQISYL